jgi:hypothetical protein
MRLLARRGIALVAALGVMTLLSLMVAGAFAASLLGERSSRLTFSDASLSASADYAITTVLADPAGYGLADLPFGQPRSFDVVVPGGARATVSVTRLPTSVLWLVADASIAGIDQGHRRVNMVARFPTLAVLPPAPIVARGNVIARDSVSFSADTTGDPDCAAANAFDVFTSLGATATVNDSARVGARANAGDSTTYYMSSQQLALLDSTGPLVHVRGDTTINGGTFTGILVADGSIAVTGASSFIGLVIARGAITATAGGFSLTGAMMAYGNPTNGTTAIELAHATIRYAPCIVANAMRRASRPKPVRQRSWAELF